MYVRTYVRTYMISIYIYIIYHIIYDINISIAYNDVHSYGTSDNNMWVLDIMLVRYHIGSQIYISEVRYYIGSPIYISEVRYTYRNYKKVGRFTIGILTQTAPHNMCLLTEYIVRTGSHCK